MSQPPNPHCRHETMNFYTAQEIQNQERLGGWGPKVLERKCVRGEEKG